MALANTPDRRVAAHLAQRLDVLGQQQRPRTAARRGQRCLGTGMSAANHDDIERFLKLHGLMWLKNDQLLYAPIHRHGSLGCRVAKSRDIAHRVRSRITRRVRETHPAYYCALHLQNEGVEPVINSVS